ncbi:hypothetical protein BGW39_008802 [Mortierella sp. 14UC]|nr:hypothetical protein BGW39_008802 [Mortierella sp. 14UC]
MSSSTRPYPRSSIREKDSGKDIPQGLFLGKGEHATVFETMWERKPCALKIQPKSAEMLKAYELHQSLNHGRSIKLHHYFEVDNLIYALLWKNKEVMERHPMETARKAAIAGLSDASEAPPTGSSAAEDILSYGVQLQEMLTGNGESKVIDELSEVSKVAEKLVKQCLREDSNARSPIDAVVTHTFFDRPRQAARRLAVALATPPPGRKRTRDEDVATGTPVVVKRAQQKEKDKRTEEEQQEDSKVNEGKEENEKRLQLNEEKDEEAAKSTPSAAKTGIAAVVVADKNTRDKRRAHIAGGTPQASAASIRPPKKMEHPEFNPSVPAKIQGSKD